MKGNILDNKYCSSLCYVDDLERKLEEVREAYEFNLDLLSEKERKLEEAREEVDYAINFFSKNEQFGVVGILKGIRKKLKDKGENEI